MLQEKDEYLRRRNLSSTRTRSRDEDTFQMDEELFNLEEDSRSTNTRNSEEAGKGHRRSWSFGSISGNFFGFEYLFHNKVISVTKSTFSVISGL